MRPSTLRRLERFNDAIEVLKKIGEKRKDVFLSDLLLISAVERNIQVGIEFLIDLSSFVLAKKGFKAPQTYKEAVKMVSKLGVVDSETAETMVELVGLRNIIVHLYADVKADVVFDNLDTIITTMKQFCDKLLRFCEKEGIDP